MKRLYRVPIAMALAFVGTLLAMLTDSTDDTYQARVENQRRMLRELWAWAWENTDTPSSISAP